MSYSGDPAASDKDMVRFLIGDTDPTAELITDAEINSLLTSYTVIGTAIACARSLAARFASKADQAIGDLKISYSQMSKAYLSLVSNLGMSPLALAAGVAPYAGGISQSDKRSNRSNLDLVRPAFTRNMMEPEGTSEAGDENAGF